MSTPQSAADVQAWKARWAAINQREIEELRRMPVELKLKQLATLMFAAHLHEDDDTRSKGVAQVRARWVALRQAYGD
jgi:hypothetical protein